MRMSLFAKVTAALFGPRSSWSSSIHLLILSDLNLARLSAALAGFVSGLEVSVSRSQALKEPTNNPLMYLSKASEVGIITI